MGTVLCCWCVPALFRWPLLCSPPCCQSADPCWPAVQERIQLETSRLYKTAGVNPLAGGRANSAAGAMGHVCADPPTTHSVML